MCGTDYSDRCTISGIYPSFPSNLEIISFIISDTKTRKYVLLFLYPLMSLMLTYIIQGAAERGTLIFFQGFFFCSNTKDSVAEMRKDEKA